MFSCRQCSRHHGRQGKVPDCKRVDSQEYRAGSVSKHMTPDLRVLSSSSMFGVEITEK